jgi:hypothetical protein
MVLPRDKAGIENPAWSWAKGQKQGKWGDPPVCSTFPDQACTGTRIFRGCEQTPPPAT